MDIYTRFKSLYGKKAEKAKEYVNNYLTTEASTVD